jgi:hypothetical protein
MDRRRNDAVLSSLRSYRNPLAVWKNTDPDIPILKEAKREYAKLQ